MYFGRGPNKVHNPYNLKDMYESYKESVEENTPYDISYKEFMTITEDYLKEISDGLLSGKGSFRIPKNLGYITITKFKVDLSKLNRIDWKATVETGKKIYHLNEHSDGFNYKVVWTRIQQNARNVKMYVFAPTRRIKRTLASLIKNREFDTYEF
jgi:hypothetical protein